MLKALYEAIRDDAHALPLMIDGRQYTTKPVVAVHDPKPETLVVSTLTGVVDYLKANVDGLVIANLLCHVESPSQVVLYNGLTGKFYDRPAYLKAELRQLQIKLNTYIDGESFNILLQSCFCEPVDPMLATDKGLVLKYVSNIKSTIESGVEDDGVSQGVTVKTGIASVGNAVLPNPVNLRPYRTFTEVEQPASRFVFRCKHDDDGMKFMLAEADGGAWRCEAMHNVKEYLEKMVPGLNVIA